MFTGLIQCVGEVVGNAAAEDAASPASAPLGPRRLRIQTRWDHRPRAGDSITIDGCCLTVVAAEPLAGAGPSDTHGMVLSFDAVAETLARTTLGSLRPGDRVNLEPSLRAEDLLGGHLVQGHVDGVGQVLDARDGEAGRRLTVGAGPDVMEMVTPKGAIAVSGVSLTVAACDRDSFEVALIPETLARTNLSVLRPGARVNLETDILARTIIHWAKNWRSGEC